MAGPVEFGIYIPQVALGFGDLLGRARLCEELGTGQSADARREGVRMDAAAVYEFRDAIFA